MEGRGGRGEGGGSRVEGRGGRGEGGGAEGLGLRSTILVLGARTCEAPKEVMPPAKSSTGPERANDAAADFRIAGCNRWPKRGRSCWMGVMVGTTTSLSAEMQSSSPQWPTMIEASLISCGQHRGRSAANRLQISWRSERVGRRSGRDWLEMSWR